MMKFIRTRRRSLAAGVIALAVLLIGGGSALAVIPALRASGVQLSPQASTTVAATKQGLWVDASNRLRYDTGAASHYVPAGAVTAKGDLISYTSAAWGVLPRGTDGQVLESRASESLGLRWVTPVSSAYSTIVNNASSLTQRSTLRVDGVELVATDNGGSTRTDLAIGLVGPTHGGTGLSTFAGSRYLRSSGADTWAASTIAAADLPAMVGDSGSGGTQGAVPAPAAGDAAAAKFLKADGTWAAPVAGQTTATCSVQTTDGTLTTCLTITPADGTVLSGTVNCAGRKTDGSETAGFLGHFRSKRAGGTTTSTRSFFSELDSDDVMWGADVVDSGSNALVQVKGNAGDTVNWVCSTQIVTAS